MLQRGRKSGASLAVVAVDGQPPRLKPPPSLGQAERNIFLELVGAVDRRHFRSSDMPLLAAYCRAVILEERAAGELAADPTSSRWLAIWEKAGRAMTALSLRLRLSPQARTHHRTVARQQGTPSGGVGVLPWDDEGFDMASRRAKRVPGRPCGAWRAF